jgi:hypothetical protein
MVWIDSEEEIICINDFKFVIKIEIKEASVFHLQIVMFKSLKISVCRSEHNFISIQKFSKCRVKRYCPFQYILDGLAPIIMDIA